MTRVRIVSSLVLAALFGCNATNTGNPTTDPPGTGAAPSGIELVRSKLSQAENAKLSETDRDQFGSDRRDFAFDLYAQVKDSGDNLFFSPYSISVALAMTYGGAKGETAREMSDALHFGSTDLHAAFNATAAALQGREKELRKDPGAAAGSSSSGDGFTLELANAAFARKDMQFVDTYLDLLAVNYGTGMFRAEFGAHAERDRMAINQWVEDRTRMRIQDLLPKDSVQADAALVLVNAIYFKASWLDPFNTEATTAATFHAPSGDKTVQMMHGGCELYTRGDGYQAIELPYISPAVRAVFILPDAGRMAAIEAGLDRAFFDKVRNGFGNYAVDLRIPRFSFDAGFKLKPALQALGMVQAFGGQADFSGMAGKPGDLLIDEVFHKAFVAMDEKGTEAAAATAVVLRPGSAPPRAEFTLDRPFVFAIYDEPTGQVLFVGRLSEPN